MIFVISLNSCFVYFYFFEIVCIIKVSDLKYIRIFRSWRPHLIVIDFLRSACVLYLFFARYRHGQNFHSQQVIYEGDLWMENKKCLTKKNNTHVYKTRVDEFNTIYPLFSLPGHIFCLLHKYKILICRRKCLYRRKRKVLPWTHTAVTTKLDPEKLQNSALLTRMLLFVRHDVQTPITYSWFRCVK